MRYQVLSQVFSASGNIGNFRPSTFVQPSAACVNSFIATNLIDPTLCPIDNGIVVPGMPGVNKSTLNNYYGDWEPRIGAAWQVLPRVVIRSGFGIFGGRDAVSQTSSLGQQGPDDRIATLFNTTYAGLAPFDPATPQPTESLKAQARNYKTPTSYQYNLSTQYLLARNTSLEVDYVGSHQVHIGRNRNINQVPDEFRAGVIQGELNGCPDPVPSPACVANPDTVRHFIGYSIINLNERAGSASYNSLQVFFNQRVMHGLQFQAAYTYSKNLTDTINQDTEASTGPIQNAFDTRSERGVANQDQTHSFVANFIWQLPFFEHNANPYLKTALGGWQVVGITTFRSGLPANVCLDSDVAGTGDGAGSYECQRPDMVSNPNLSRGKRTINEFFDVNAFVERPFGAFGDATRNIIRGPGVNNWDLSVFKDFTVPWFGRHSGFLASENATLQFRAEFFNAWNHTQFSGVNTTFQTQAPGLPSGNTNGFGSVSGARDPREIQFALKLTF